MANPDLRQRCVVFSAWQAMTADGFVIFSNVARPLDKLLFLLSGKKHQNEMLFLAVESQDRCRLIVCHCAPSKSLPAVLYKYCNFTNFRCSLNFGNFGGQQFYRIQNDTERE